MLKKLFSLLLIIIAFQSSKAQNDSLQWLDLELANYQYPFPLYLDLKAPEQDLKMAYIDIKPANYNGKNIVLIP
ncbi:hypothetical protein [Aequorivita sp. Q41]|uniref:hypothetical protein n=1 Tax=Aequorivita sp. Q41 TaxID=3153300 RepID=UPI0032420F92